MEKKMVYEKPELLVHGKVAEMTLGASCGSYLDATFPTNTPFDQLTFSGTGNNGAGCPR